MKSILINWGEKVINLSSKEQLGYLWLKSIVIFEFLPQKLNQSHQIFLLKP
jgi:hypothetical protein